MPRANRYFTLGDIWHMTHRCHQSDFLFKFEPDRKNWLKWLIEGKRRYKIPVLNYIVTSNHIHLLVSDNQKKEDSISKFMQLIQGRTGQDYNLRKKHKGSFWTDRFHATAIGTDDHLLNCINYINLNMVRAGAVKHPVEWKESGFYELMHPKERNAILDYDFLLNVLKLDSIEQLQKVQQDMVNDALERNDLKREAKWTESLAVGNEAFVESIKQKLGINAIYRKITKTEESFQLSEGEIPYISNFDL